MGSTTGTWTRGRSAGRWRRASILAGGGETASTSTLATTDDGDVVRGCGSWCVVADCAWEPLVSNGGFWKNFLFFVAASSRCSHLEIWILPSPLYLFSLCSGEWVLPVEYGVLDSSGRVRYLVQLWIYVYGRHWTNFSIFYVVVNSNPEAFILHSA